MMLGTMNNRFIGYIFGKNHQQAIVSIVERKSKFTFLKKVNRKTAANVSQAVIDTLKGDCKPVLILKF